MEFQAREFVLHLFARLCAEVLGRGGLERVRRPPTPAGRGLRLSQVLLAYLLFAATCQQFFRVPIGELEQARWHDFMANADRLGVAQQAFSVHPEAAWIATSHVRAGLKFEPVPYPLRP